MSPNDTIYTEHGRDKLTDRQKRLINLGLALEGETNNDPAKQAYINLQLALLKAGVS